jgi:hypothetical protein
LQNFVSFCAILHYKNFCIAKIGKKLLGKVNFPGVFAKLLKNLCFLSQNFCEKKTGFWENFCEKTKAKTFVKTLVLYIDCMLSWVFYATEPVPL